MKAESLQVEPECFRGRPQKMLVFSAPGESGSGTQIALGHPGIAPAGPTPDSPSVRRAASSRFLFRPGRTRGELQVLLLQAEHLGYSQGAE